MTPVAGRFQPALAILRARGPVIAVDLGANVLAPLCLYYLALGRGGVVSAYVAAAFPPLAVTGFNYLRTGRTDALALFAVASILSPLVATIGGGSGQWLQLQLKLPLLLFGLTFLTSAALRKPLIFPLARATVARESEAALARFEARVEEARFERTMVVMTLVWGGALVVEFGANAALICTTSPSLYLIVAPVFGYAASAALLAWTLLYRRARTREVPPSANSSLPIGVFA